MNLPDLTKLFPAVIAPAIVAHLRARLPRLDGLLVWAVVVAVAVLLSLGIAALNGQAVTLATVRDGVLLGLLAAGVDTVANGKPKAKEDGVVASASIGPGQSATLEAHLDGAAPPGTVVMPAAPDTPFTATAEPAQFDWTDARPRESHR